MVLNNVDLNKIRVFHSVVKHGGYRKAGEEIGLTRSAISQSITTLESQLGVALFLRRGKKLFPTKSAQQLADHFSSYQHSLGQMLDEMASSDQETQGVIRVGAYYEFAKMKLAEWIGTFSQNHPRVQFRLTFDAPSRLESAMESGLLDLNFSIFPHRRLKGVESTPVFHQEMVLVAPNEMAPQASKAGSLLKLPCIEYYRNYQLIPQWMQTHFGIKRELKEIKAFAGSAEMVLALVAQGLGVGVVPKYLVEHDNRHSLCVIRPTPEQFKTHIWLHQFTNQFENLAHKAFFEFLKQENNSSLTA